MECISSHITNNNSLIWRTRELCHPHFGEWSCNSLRFSVLTLLLQFVSFSSNKTLWSFHLPTKDQQSRACLPHWSAEHTATHWLKQGFSVERGWFPKVQWHFLLCSLSQPHPLRTELTRRTLLPNSAHSAFFSWRDLGTYGNSTEAGACNFSYPSGLGKLSFHLSFHEADLNG